MPHAGRQLIAELEARGASAIFTVPGESFLAALDGMHTASTIRPIVCRQEGGAAMMADAWGKVTGAPGICFVTRGPGLANAMSGLHVAQQDSTPMILFLGLPASQTEDREAFQEIETKGLLSTYVKWAAVIRDAARIPEYVSRAYHVAMSGRRGPVVLGLPEDMLARDMPEPAPARLPAEVAAAPRPSDMAALTERLAKAERPLVIAGGSGWSSDVRTQLQTFARAQAVPLASSFRTQDFIDNQDPSYAGSVGIGLDKSLADAVRDSDLLIAIGSRLGEITTGGYTLVDSPYPKQPLVHVHADPDELGTVYVPEIAINATSASFVAALSELEIRGEVTRRQPRVEALHAAYLRSIAPVDVPGDVALDRVIAQLSEALPDDAIVTNGAGNYAAFLNRFYQYRGYPTQLAPTSGSMGYGVPAAIAAKLAHPDRPVVAFAGDGCFMMTSQELATAMQYDLAIVIVVVNNGMYGTIRMHQEREYPAREVATALTNPDFAKFAESFGAHGETVTRTDGFKPALDRALAAGRAALIELKTDPEAITPRQTLSQIRSAAT
ncbi:MAG: thiamine pyrophosphate-binding protein [Pseudomonadota bacterium]